MSRNYKHIFLGFAFLFGAIAVYWFILQPVLIKARLTTEQIASKTAELQMIKFKVAHLAVMEQNLRNAQVQGEKAVPTIPATLTLAELYNGIDSLTRKSGLRIKQISTSQTFQPFAQDHQLNFIALDLEGDSYFPQIISFLDLIAKNNFLLQIAKLDISSLSKGRKPRLHFKITLNAFEYSAASLN